MSDLWETVKSWWGATTPSATKFDPASEPCSLETLAKALRDQSSWPINFRWNYTAIEMCAMGLMQRIWFREMDVYEFYKPEVISEKLNIDETNAIKIFLNGGAYLSNTPVFTITPEMVADKIDEFISREKMKDQGRPFQDFFCEPMT